MLLVFFGGVVIAGLGQGKKKLPLPSAGMCPLREGVATVDTFRQYYYGDPRPGLTIEGKDSLVLSVRDGEVQAVFSVGDVKAVIIRSGTYYFYTCTNLDSVYVSKGQQVKAGQVLGTRPVDLPLEFLFSLGDGRDRWDQQRFVDCKVVYAKRR